MRTPLPLRLSIRSCRYAKSTKVSGSPIDAMRLYERSNVRSWLSCDTTPLLVSLEAQYNLALRLSGCHIHCVGNSHRSLHERFKTCSAFQVCMCWHDVMPLAASCTSRRFCNRALTTKPNQTKPNQTKPNQTKSNQIKSNQTSKHNTHTIMSSGWWLAHTCSLWN
jgi:hypothetical protein